MDLKEFNRRLNEEPRSDYPEMLKAKGESLQHAAAYRDALQFEDLLEHALRLPVEEDTADQILEHCLGPASNARWRLPGWIAVAATFAVAAVVVVLLAPANRVDAELRDTFVAHLEHPEPALLSDVAMDGNEVRLLMARLGVDAQGSLDGVTYFSPCMIGGQQGLHWVVTDEQGRKTTLMMIPGEQLSSAFGFSVGDVTAQLVPTDAGPVALFGHQGQDVEAMGAQLGGRFSPLARSAQI